MNIDAFHTIILPLKDKLFRLVYGIIREQTEAEDILQDVLLKLWTRKEEWQDIENIEAYCFRATKNLALDRLASNSIRKTRLIEPEKENMFFVDDNSPHRVFVKKEQRNIIRQCIETLSENQKLVFQLREMEGMSYKEISEALAISEDLVKISLFRARKKMKELLNGFEENEY